MESSALQVLSAQAPLITAIVATYNEEAHILQCLEGLLQQRGLEERFEIIVVDGDSRDATVEIVKSLPEFGRRIRVLRNPRRLQVYAWNIGWKAASGEFIALISAHTEYSRDYLAECLEVMRRTGAANVGGVQVAVGDAALGRVIAWAMSTPFGVGNADFRYTTEEKCVDSVFGGFFHRKTLDAVGGYDESNPFDEDTDINYRLRSAGGKIVVSPAIEVRYHARSSLARLAHQMYRYGYWRRRTQMQHPGAVPARVLIPPLLVVSLLVSLVAFAEVRNALVLLPWVAYLGFLLIGAGLAASALRDPAAAVLAPLVLSVMHVSYGVGWLVGLFAHRKDAGGRSHA